MKNLCFITFLIMFSLAAQDFKCRYNSTGHFCGDYAENDPHVLANSECEAAYNEGVIIDRRHVKLNANGTVKCPVELDQARKDAYLAAKQAEADQQASDEAERDLLKQAYQTFKNGNATTAQIQRAIAYLLKKTR